MCATVKTSEQRLSLDWKMLKDCEDCATSVPGKHNYDYRHQFAGFMK